MIDFGSVFDGVIAVFRGYAHGGFLLSIDTTVYKAILLQIKKKKKAMTFPMDLVSPDSIFGKSHRC